KKKKKKKKKKNENQIDNKPKSEAIRKPAEFCSSRWLDGRQPHDGLTVSGRDGPTVTGVTPVSFPVLT
ncbi:hypothetical protein A2U01_0117268, partial [Trifolium medium]|nr:hypothetical protein [Trifolium medium]